MVHERLVGWIPNAVNSHKACCSVSLMVISTVNLLYSFTAHREHMGHYFYLHSKHFLDLDSLSILEQQLPLLTKESWFYVSSPRAESTSVNIISLFSLLINECNVVCNAACIKLLKSATLSPLSNANGRWHFTTYNNPYTHRLSWVTGSTVVTQHIKGTKRWVAGF